MTNEPTVIPPLNEALNTFQSTRSAYQSTSDQALTQIVLALSAEMITLRRDLLAAPPAPAPAVPPGDTLAELRALREQIAQLQISQAAQATELHQLRRQIDALAPRKLSVARDAPIPPSPPKVIRPIDYWAKHVPDYGDQLSQPEIDSYLERPRVRPQDVVLSNEDLARQKRRRYQRSDWWPVARAICIRVVIVALLVLAFWIVVTSVQR